MPKPATPAPGLPPLICLWPERLLFVGPLGKVAPHRHAATVLLVALQGEVRVWLSAERQWHSAQSALVPAGCMHALDLREGITAVFYNDPHRPFHPRMSARDGGAAQFDPVAGTPLPEALRAFHASQGANAVALEHALATTLGRYPQAPLLDARVQQAIQLVQADLTENLPLAALAEAAALSPSRLQHLFQDQTGVPLRRFRNWIRFRHALERIAAGATLTTAAFDAGFASSTHFSHAFKAMFGVAPASVLAGSSPPRILTLA
ncbi:AraC family transcriptional regulator [Solimonas sp. K1W22B-7]|uniref:AraC family transcriptional regulator n=1 Tax=Solimonas sp. K1W22B-7 TaxID=2303331 RepID=UPI0013C408D6|nr:helix-turn-helix domain-containing protein [Solimonas sp. K1W22B-7]